MGWVVPQSVVGRPVIPPLTKRPFVKEIVVSSRRNRISSPIRPSTFLRWTRKLRIKPIGVTIFLWYFSWKIITLPHNYISNPRSSGFRDRPLPERDSGPRLRNTTEERRMIYILLQFATYFIPSLRLTSELLFVNTTARVMSRIRLGKFYGRTNCKTELNVILNLTVLPLIEYRTVKS